MFWNDHLKVVHSMPMEQKGCWSALLRMIDALYWIIPESHESKYYECVLYTGFLQ